ncbi:hypothetical protein STCU_00776 [Strigomonas culicis]|uniref:Uncharacterized protein n=1 Tax=Strigomonas culicis TaxID=28005 RepID=S9V5B6_9TRYP|nr:hypothetical protein STCU_00776 [Strigomonas culicis]|eukprot:EPY36058.1 hypothetical protein STCU_00776 [Strigomonas culicis]
MGNCLGCDDAFLSEGERELARRREALIERNRLEQAQWRERRLRDVVIVLVERGEATEGVPLAFQLHDKSEVAARRRVRNVERLSPEARREMELTNAAAAEADRRRYDAAALAVMRRPLRELLADGRPTECLPAPDIMQLLLQGHEVTVSDIEDDVSTTSEREEPGASSPAHEWSPEEADTTADGTPAPAGAATNVPETPRRQMRHRKASAIIRGLHYAQHRQQHHRRTAEEVYGAGVVYTPNVCNRFSWMTR